jgi:hypothetical protein
MADSKASFKYRTVRGFSLGFNGFEDDQDDGALDLALLNPFLSASSLGKVSIWIGLLFTMPNDKYYVIFNYTHPLLSGSVCLHVIA